MKLVLLDRDGVINVPRKYHVKSPPELELLPGAAEALARLTRAGVRLAICTNQPQVARGIITQRQLDAIHEDLCARLARKGAHIDLVLCCTDDDCESAARKPAPGMLVDAMRQFGAKPADTPFVGDQVDDLEAAAKAGCARVLVRSGNGAKTERGFPNTVQPVAVHDDLAAFVEAYLRGKQKRRPVPTRHEPPPAFRSRRLRDYQRSHRRRAAWE